MGINHAFPLQKIPTSSPTFISFKISGSSETVRESRIMSAFDNITCEPATIFFKYSNAKLRDISGLLAETESGRVGGDLAVCARDSKFGAPKNVKKLIHLNLKKLKTLNKIQCRILSWKCLLQKKLKPF